MISCSCDSLTRGLIVILLNISHHHLPQHVPTRFYCGTAGSLCGLQRGAPATGTGPPAGQEMPSDTPSSAQAQHALLPIQRMSFPPRGGPVPFPKSPALRREAGSRGAHDPRTAGPPRRTWARARGTGPLLETSGGTRGPPCPFLLKANSTQGRGGGRRGREAVVAHH